MQCNLCHGKRCPGCGECPSCDSDYGLCSCIFDAPQAQHDEPPADEPRCPSCNAIGGCGCGQSYEEEVPLE